MGKREWSSLIKIIDYIIKVKDFYFNISSFSVSLCQFKFHRELRVGWDLSAFGEVIKSLGESCSKIYSKDETEIQQLETKSPYLFWWLRKCFLFDDIHTFYLSKTIGFLLIVYHLFIINLKLISI